MGYYEKIQMSTPSDRLFDRRQITATHQLEMCSGDPWICRILDLDGCFLYDVSREHHTYTYCVLENHPTTGCDYFIYPPFRHGLRMLNLTTGQVVDLGSYATHTPYFWRSFLSPCDTKLAVGCLFWGGNLHTAVFDLSQPDTHIEVLFHEEGGFRGWIDENSFKIWNSLTAMTDLSGNLSYPIDFLEDWRDVEGVELVNLSEIEQLHWISEDEYDVLEEQRAVEVDFEFLLNYRFLEKKHEAD
jgi:hypothetical protein